MLILDNIIYTKKCFFEKRMFKNYRYCPRVPRERG